MYIYADESGHSGRYIFNEPLYYLQGALFCEKNMEADFAPVIQRQCGELGASRIHANELPPVKVTEFANTYLDVLSDHKWQFHLTLIQKPYMATTKFVDSIFDSGENYGVRWIWYNHEFFRHTLCCLFDNVLTERNRRKFWDAYLLDDYEGILASVRNARTYLDRFAKDRRLKTVALDGLDFALRYPEQITLMANKTRSSYKGHTPNMVAFASLIQAVHKFCKIYGLAPTAFYHDQQSEFGQTMREYHELFSTFRIPDATHGLSYEMLPEKTKYPDIGKFALASSKDLYGLQIVDVFLWLSQREPTEDIRSAQERLKSCTDAFFISRNMSEFIVYAWQKRLSQLDLSHEDLERGKDLVDSMEDQYIARLKSFKKGDVI